MLKQSHGAGPHTYLQPASRRSPYSSAASVVAWPLRCVCEMKKSHLPSVLGTFATDPTLTGMSWTASSSRPIVFLACMMSLTAWPPLMPSPTSASLVYSTRVSTSSMPGKPFEHGMCIAAKPPPNHMLRSDPCSKVSLVQTVGCCEAMCPRPAFHPKSIDQHHTWHGTCCTENPGFESKPTPTNPRQQERWRPGQEA